MEKKELSDKEKFLHRTVKMREALYHLAWKRRIGRILEGKRNDLGLAKSELGERVKLSAEIIEKIEKGAVTLKRLDILARAMKVTPGWILRQEEMGKWWWSK